MTQQDFINGVEQQLSFFDERKSKLLFIADKHKDLSIKGIDDKENYNKVKLALSELRVERVSLQKDAKSMRDVFTKANRLIRTKELEQIGIISPIEDNLKEQKEKIDNIKIIEERKVLLPLRKGQLEELKIEMKDDEILLYNEKQWAVFYTEKINEKKEVDEKKKQEQERIKQIEKEAKEKAEKELADKQKIEAEEKEKAEKEMLKNKKLNDFLKKNGYTKDDNFIIKRVENKVYLYKKIGEIEL